MTAHHVPQPSPELNCPAALASALELLRLEWDGLRPDAPSPFSNTGARFSCPVFEVHAYSWSDTDQPYNFRWRDLQVRWYKYFGRSMTVNRAVSAAELCDLSAECSAALRAGAAPVVA